MNYSFREAAKSDAEAITALVDAAYSHYVERLGIASGPTAIHAYAITTLTP